MLTMKKITTTAILLGILLLGVIPAHATIWTFRPDPIDIYDLDHRWYYEWGVDWAEGQTETVTEVQLKFHNIRDYIVEPDDILYMNLLDESTPGVTAYWDEAEFGNAWAGQGVEITTWTDPLGAPNPAVDLTISFAELGKIDDFILAASDGNFGLAFDPDCHYNNDGIELIVETSAPEPGTLTLLALGLSMAGGVACRRRKK